MSWKRPAARYRHASDLRLDDRRPRVPLHARPMHPLASLTASRYFQFPDPEMGPGLVAARPSHRSKSISSSRPRSRIALAGDRDRRRASPFSARSPSRATIGRAARSIRSSCCCRSSFRSRCWVSLCCCGSTRSASICPGQTAVFAHLVWIVPVVTLVIAIQVYSFDPALEEAAFDLGATPLAGVARSDVAGAVPGHRSRARSSPSCCPGAIFPCRFSRPAPTRPCPNISMPRWSPATRRACRCWAPSRPFGAAILLLGGYWLILR